MPKTEQVAIPLPRAARSFFDAKTINYKKLTISHQKIIPLGPVHLDQISDKLDYPSPS